MNWCNCNYENHHFDYYLNYSFSYDMSVTCTRCNNRVSQEQVIMILLHQVTQLKDIVEDLRVEKIERDAIKTEEEYQRVKEENEIMKNLDKDTERFKMMDL